jgi:hypothetical protein
MLILLAIAQLAAGTVTWNGPPLAPEVAAATMARVFSPANAGLWREPGDGPEIYVIPSRGGQRPFGALVDAYRADACAFCSLAPL